MTITPFTGGFVQTNGYLLESEEGAVVVDAPAGMADFVTQRGIQPAALLLTHQHFDHVEDADTFSKAGVPIHSFACYDPDLVLDEAARRWGLPTTITPFTVTHLLEGLSAVTVAGLTFDLLHVPGHSPDSLVFHVGPIHKLFAGDTLFAGSVGRCDLPGGDESLLINGIRNKLLVLSDETEVLPGHGPSTTIAREKAGNPYIS